LDDHEENAKLIKNIDITELGIGGLREECSELFRRALSSRACDPSLIKELGIKHCRGVILYGPPGTGKTLIARKISSILNSHPPKIISGPEVFSKYVGDSEENA